MGGWDLLDDLAFRPIQAGRYTRRLDVRERLSRNEVDMVTTVNEGLRVTVPAWVTSLEAFRRWSDADDFPEHGQIWWLAGEVWIDMSGWQVFTHVRVKTRFSSVLDVLASEQQLGMYLTAGAQLSNFEADISGKPDSLFLSNDTLQSDRIRLIEGAQGG